MPTLHVPDDSAVSIHPLLIPCLAALTACGGDGPTRPPVEGGGGPLGPGASLKGRRPFPADNPWNADVSGEPVDPNSAALVAACGDRGLHADFGTVWNGAPNGIPYVVVAGTQNRVPVTFDYADESDAGPYPIPPDAPIEGGPGGAGDRHVLIIDRDNWKLYELFDAHPVNGGQRWTAGSGAVFDLNSNALRPAGWTSADAAGLPIFPGLVRYDEVVELKEIRHALRFTCPTTRRAYVHPARHFASSRTDPNLPPMGMRVRLRASYRRQRLFAQRARDPDRDEEARDAAGGQRQRLVRERRPRPALERRRVRHAQPRPQHRFRGGADGDDRHAVRRMRRRDGER